MRLNKGIFSLLVYVVMAIIYLASISSCSKMRTGHECRWVKCPYKGQTISTYVNADECEEGSDCYIIDRLHILYPTKDYDQLEDLLFN